MDDLPTTAMQEAELRMLRNEQRQMSSRKRDLLDQISKIEEDVMRISWRIYDLEKQQ